MLLGASESTVKHEICTYFRFSSFATCNFCELDNLLYGLFNCSLISLHVIFAFNNHMNTGIGVSQSNISRNEYIYIYKKDIAFYILA